MVVEFALAEFDGTHLYEHEDPRRREHKDWGTRIFNYGRSEVRNGQVVFPDTQQRPHIPAPRVERH